MVWSSQPATPEDVVLVWRATTSSTAQRPCSTVLLFITQSNDSPLTWQGFACSNSYQTARVPMERQNYLIHQLYVRQQYEECVNLIGQVLAETDERSEYALYVKALIERQQGKIQDSLKLFQQATALNPHNIANLKQVGRSWYLLGKHRAAAEVYDEAIKLDSQDWELWFNKGMCAVQTKDYDRALDCFRRANSIQPHDATYMQIGALHLEQGQVEQALNTYLEALEHSPENPDILTTLGVTFLRLGDNQRAFDHLGTSLMHDPRNPRTILAAGSIIQDHQDMDVALVKYRVAAATCPNSPQLWNNIGMCFFGKQKYIAAIACLKRALYLGPFEWLIAYNLGLVHLATGQAASAFHYLSTAVNLKPEFSHRLEIAAQLVPPACQHPDLLTAERDCWAPLAPHGCHKHNHCAV
eukprot:GHUV01023071.1.p1 GENE.GHUV01023071.1~~GHUV01023071.1.p1  ORF type:complete len:412 (+),score=86.66 GHUV01023071.1:96-1331(+)